MSLQEVQTDSWWGGVGWMRTPHAQSVFLFFPTYTGRISAVLAASVILLRHLQLRHIRNMWRNAADNQAKRPCRQTGKAVAHSVACRHRQIKALFISERHCSQFEREWTTCDLKWPQWANWSGTVWITSSVPLFCSFTNYFGYSHLWHGVTSVGKCTVSLGAAGLDLIRTINKPVYTARIHICSAQRRSFT